MLLNSYEPADFNRVKCTTYETGQLLHTLCRRENYVKSELTESIINGTRARTLQSGKPKRFVNLHAVLFVAVIKTAGESTSVVHGRSRPS